MSFDLSRVGKATGSPEFRVNAMRLAGYAEAIDDENERHSSGALATPLFVNIVPMQAMFEALQGVTKTFCVHGAHDFRYHRPIVPGMRLFSRAVVIGVRPSSAGVSVVIRLDVTDEHGEPVNTQFFTGFAPGATLAEGAGAAPPDHRIAEGVTASQPVAVRTCPMTLDHTRRYGEAARDYADYTMDPEAARAKGFEHPIAHGMLTMAIASRAVVEVACGGDSNRLMRLAGRFSSPVFLVPGQRVTTKLWRTGDRTFAYEAYDLSGKAVIRHGLAEVAA